jgi:hypothetical protein
MLVDGIEAVNLIRDILDILTLVNTTAIINKANTACLDINHMCSLC